MAVHAEEADGAISGIEQYDVPLGTVHAGTMEDPCEAVSGSGTDGDPYIFQVAVDFFQSSTGYYTFTNCDGVKPTLKVRAGSVYKFVQEHITNHMHPLGFAYEPDGAHKGVDELELGVKPPGSASDCDSSSSCQAPMYYAGNSGDVFLGGSGLLSSASDPYAGVGDGGFGLDSYEPAFEGYQATWRFNKYNVRVMITDDATAEYFYFCHLHEWMTGRIIVTNADGSARSGAGSVELYDPVKRSDLDMKCGFTAAPNYGDAEGPGAFGLSSGKCDNAALCGTWDTFRECNEAIDCHMNYNMRITHSSDKVITFMRQMIPHHQNAVNMAKILLFDGKDDVAAADNALGDDAFIASMLQDVINSQNMQIMNMMAYLKDNDSPVYDVKCSSSLEINEDLAWGYAAAGLVVGAVLIGIGYFIYSKKIASRPTPAAKQVDPMPERDVSEPNPAQGYWQAVPPMPGYFPPQV